MRRRMKAGTLLLVSVLSLGMAIPAGPVFGAELTEFTDAVGRLEMDEASGEEILFDSAAEIPEVEFESGEHVQEAGAGAFFAEGEVPETVTLDGITYEYMAETDSYRIVKGVNVEEVKIPKEIHGKMVREIGTEAFKACKKLKRITGEYCVDSYTIMERAFEGCENLRYVTFPVSEGITVESKAFRNCPRLVTFNVSGYQAVTGKFAEDAFDSDTKVMIFYYVGIGGDETTELLDRLRIFHTPTDEIYSDWLETINGLRIFRKINENHKEISYVTDGDENLENVMVYDDYKNDITIGRKAFYGFSNLKNVRLTEQVKSIETKAFYGCRNLRRIIIPESVTSIAPDAFAESPNVVIYAQEGSYASDYAKANGIACEYRLEKMERPVMKYEKGGYLKWNPVLFADGYQVYKYDWEKRKYIRVADIADGKKCSYSLLRKLERGETAYYKVRAYSSADIYSNKYSPSSMKVLVKKFPDDPDVLSVSNKQKNKLIVKWRKPKGAEWYSVYRAETIGNSSALRKIKTISDGNTTSFVDTNVEKGKTYYYYIKAFRKFGDATLSSRWYGSPGWNTCR